MLDRIIAHLPIGQSAADMLRGTAYQNPIVGGGGDHLIVFPVERTTSDKLIELCVNIPVIISHIKCVSTLPKPLDNFEVKFDISSSNLLFKAV